jgi:hypothetical protein
MKRLLKDKFNYMGRRFFPGDYVIIGITMVYHIYYSSYESQLFIDDVLLTDELEQLIKENS